LGRWSGKHNTKPDAGQRIVFFITQSIACDRLPKDEKTNERGSRARPESKKDPGGSMAKGERERDAHSRQTTPITSIRKYQIERILQLVTSCEKIGGWKTIEMGRGDGKSRG